MQRLLLGLLLVSGLVAGGCTMLQGDGANLVAAKEQAEARKARYRGSYHRWPRPYISPGYMGGPIGIGGFGGVGGFCD